MQVTGRVQHNTDNTPAASRLVTATPRSSWTILGAACITGGLCLSPLLSARTAAAQASASPGTLTSGATPGQAGLLPNAPSAVPDARTAATPPVAGANAATARPDPTVAPLTSNLQQYSGRTVTEIRYEGVTFDKTDRLITELTQKSGTPLVPDDVRQTTRRLFATGRYRNIAVRVEPLASSAQSSTAGVVLIFAGVPRYYVGRIQINGVTEERLASLLEFGTKLDPGTGFTGAAVTAGTESVKQVLAQNGYYEPVIAVKTTRDDAGQQINVTYTVAIGPQATVGAVTLTGANKGITEAEFLKVSKLRTRILKHAPKVDRETTSNALSDLRAYFQKKNRLEATVSLQKSIYVPASRTLNYEFAVDQGPVVAVKVEGAKISSSRLKLLVPVYEEGTIDIDLLNEGSFNMRDYLQQQGYFDAKVEVKVIGEDTPSEVVLYTVQRGEKHKVVDVTLQGNKYFSTDLLKQGLRVQKADAYMRSGRFSNQLVAADQKSIQSIYRANGFRDAVVTSKIQDVDVGKNGKPEKVDQISVRFSIDEGTQQTFGPVELNGMDAARRQTIMPLLAAQEGQPFSLTTLSGDRDVILSYYLSNGFDQARIEVAQDIEKDDKAKVDIGYNVTEGKQVFIGKVLESGDEHTKPAVINAQTEVHPGDPLDQSALLTTQRNLYNLALFNEVIAAVQNPTGDAEQKNVLLQLTEAKRWDVTYGFGFEAQTGTPGCGQYCTQTGTSKAQQGHAGVSPRVSLDISRINVFGTDDTLTLHTTYGLLEKVAILSFQNPHLFGHKNFAAQISGGYSNVQDISTFKSSKLQGDLRLTQRATRKDTFVYDFQYRRISVDANSLAISSNLIPILSQPVRVGGPGITWLHDTRTPSPLDAVKGSYTSVDEFFAAGFLGSQVQFNRTDITNSSYYQFGKGRNKYVFARQARFGFIKATGTNPNAGIAGCTGTLLNLNASCNAVPLPERLYAGGATSDRGFPINGAGPRDLQTGFPVGGSGVFINTLELRLPPPTLPYVGDAVSFVIFHDMGNVFYHVSDVFPSIKNFHQPNEQTCEQVTGVTTGTCNFNYYTHTIGLGARYRTPVGPIRVDLGYNLNPPKYPVIPTIDPTTGTYVNGQQPYVGQGNHLNFFFSIGQSF